MKRFVLADGDVLLEKPVYVGTVRKRYYYAPRMPTSFDYQFIIVLAGDTEVVYRSKWQVEAERERQRLLEFNWNTNEDTKDEA